MRLKLLFGMINPIKKFTCIIILFCIPLYVSAQGLQFSSINKLIADRTAYDVFNGKSQLLNEYTEINFDLSIIDPNLFGYILSLKDHKNGTQYNLSYTGDNENTAYLNLSAQNKTSLLQIPVNKKELGNNRWLKVSFILNSKNSSVTLILNNKSYSATTKLENKILLELFFGKHDSFIDLPEMAIKNLEIKGKNKTYSFSFKEFNGNVVHDDSGKAYGIVENPVWLINKSYYWKLRNTISSKSVCAVNYDQKNQRFIVVNSDSIIYYNLSNDQTTSNLLISQSPVPMRLGMSFIPDGLEKFYIYELNDVRIDKPTVSSLDLNRLSWENCCDYQLNEQKHHHNSYFDKSTNNLWVFGGFGNQHYSNDFYTFNLTNNTWTKEQLTGDNLPPRFFSGIAPLNDTELILFGGVGNPTGDKTIGKIYYTDCYKINLKERSIKKAWDLQNFDQQMVSGRNLIISADSSSFYAIYYKEYISNTNLNVYKFNIENGAHEIVGDSIPMISERIRTNTTLYKNDNTNELYCVNQVFQLDGSSKTEIYSLLAPPVARKELTRASFSKKHFQIKIASFAALLILLIILLLRLWKNKKNTKLHNQRDKLLQSENRNLISDSPKKNAVYIFGSFLAYDTKGTEISHLFSPKILQLFLLILLNSKGKKVTSSDIYEALWPDKPSDKAKNSKGVTLNHLRKILYDIEGIELKNENKHLYFDFSEFFYCDFLIFSNYLKEFNSENKDIEELTEKIIGIATEGRFLQCTNEDCFDKYKQNLENEILKIIPYQIEKSFKEHNYTLVIKLVRILHKIDQGNELAFHYELISLTKLGMNEKARKKFNAFLIDYKKENNDDFQYTFRDLVSHKSMEIIKEKSFF